MACRRLSELIEIIKQMFKPTFKQQLTVRVAVLISLLMFIASFYIRQIFKLQGQDQQITQRKRGKSSFGNY